jgi:DNA-binding LacI/PurR family transcriptional regulator
MSKSFPVTVRDIAKFIGMSHATVSRALSNNPKITDKTRLKVEAAVKKLGYTKNPLVSQLTSQLRLSRKKRYKATLAFLNTFSSPELRADWKNYCLTFEACKTHAQKLGYEVELFWFKQPGLKGKSISRILLARNIRGLIIPPIPRPHGHLTLEWQHFACATVGFMLLAPHLHSSASRHHHDILLTLRKLHKYGYRRIGLALRVDSNEYSDGLYEGRFLLHQSLLSPSEQIPILCKGGINLNFSLKDFQHWVKKYRPDAVITIGTEVLDWCKKLGIKIPEDLAVADLDLTEEDGSCAGIKVPLIPIANAAVELVVEQINNNSYGVPPNPKNVLLEGVWIDGKTLPHL